MISHISAIFRKRDESHFTKSSAWMNFWGFDDETKYKILCLELMNKLSSKKVNLPQPNAIFLHMMTFFLQTEKVIIAENYNISEAGDPLRSWILGDVDNRYLG